MARYVRKKENVWSKSYLFVFCGRCLSDQMSLSYLQAKGFGVNREVVYAVSVARILLHTRGGPYKCMGSTTGGYMQRNRMYFLLNRKQINVIASDVTLLVCSS